MNKLKVYTDGACTLNCKNEEYSKGPGGWAYCLEDSSTHNLVYKSGGFVETTNNECELYAIKQGLTAAFEKGYSNIEVYSDSAYCVNIFTQWASNWEKNGWTRGKKKEEIKNLKLVQEIWKMMKSANITFIKVKGHSDDVKNAFVDKLAVSAKKA